MQIKSGQQVLRSESDFADATPSLKVLG